MSSTKQVLTVRVVDSKIEITFEGQWNGRDLNRVLARLKRAYRRRHREVKKDVT